VSDPQALPHPDAGSSTVDQVALGVFRVGDWMVNVYLVQQDGRLTVIDSGLPGLYLRLTSALTQIGQTVGDVDAVLITHGHPDHIGLAERLRVEAEADVWVHQADAPLLTDPRHISAHWKPERSLVPYVLRRPAVLKTPIHLARDGGFRPKPVRETRTFTGGEILDVPGQPRTISLPGHTTGSSAFLFPDHGVIFTGDALVTRDDIVGRTGPRIVAAAFTQDTAQALASLNALSTLTAPLVLPGHGDPFTAGIAAAVDLAVSAGPS
jgi:glyoxylase-like metal-dependent hydrolase (beta-lactamase superfamily II)